MCSNVLVKILCLLEIYLELHGLNGGDEVLEFVNCDGRRFILGPE